jgi:N6-adenosine-specific RNA methylase IME4
MGYYTRQNPEVCLIGVKGKNPSLSNDVHCLIKSKIREHSRKPDEVRNLIIKICGDKTRIELFARERVDGWDWDGDELSATIQKLIT